MLFAWDSQTCGGYACGSPNWGFADLQGDANSGQPALGRSKPESGCPLVGDAHRTQQVSRHASGSIDMHASLTQAHSHTVT